MCNNWIWIILLLCCCKNGSSRDYNCNHCDTCHHYDRDCDCECGCDNDRISHRPIAPFAPKCDCDD